MSYPGDVDAYYLISDRGIHKTREIEQKKCGCRLDNICIIKIVTHGIFTSHKNQQ